MSDRPDGVNTKVDMKFFVVLHTDDGVRYGATVPDLPGCFSGGDTLELALQNVHEAIDLHVETLIPFSDYAFNRSPIDSIPTKLS